MAPFLDSSLPLLLAQAAGAAEAAPIERLDPPTRAMVLMALVALVLTGLGLIGLTMIGARWMRRIAQDHKPPQRWPKRRDFDPPRREPPMLDDGPAIETLAGRPQSEDTVSE